MHCTADRMKPILHGALAAWTARVSAVINTFAGLGYAFTDRPHRVSLLRVLTRLGLRVAVRLSRSVVICRNAEDQKVM